MLFTSYLLPETQDTTAIKKRLLGHVNKLVLISDETFVKVLLTLIVILYVSVKLHLG